MYTHDLHAHSHTAPLDRTHGLRLWTAAVLRACGQALHHLAARLTHTEAPVETTEPWIEFYANAGAPEGALYINGKLVGHIEGVNRL